MLKHPELLEVVLAATHDSLAGVENPSTCPAPCRRFPRIKSVHKQTERYTKSETVHP